MKGFFYLMLGFAILAALFNPEGLGIALAKGVHAYETWEPSQ